MGPPDVTDLRAALDALNQEREEGADTVEWERTHDADLRYRYGSERTFMDLALAVLRVYDDVEGEMEGAHDPMLRIGPDESIEAATERIGNEIGRRAAVDARTALLHQRWGWYTCSTAIKRYVQFAARRCDLLTSQTDDAIRLYTSPTISRKLAMDVGLDEPLPGVSQ